MKSFPLRPEPDPTATWTPERALRWELASRQEEAGQFNFWEKGGPMPNWSLPALEAAKCAQSQGEGFFSRYDELLFNAYFVDNRDISNVEVLVELAENAGLDIPTFRADLESGSQRRQVIEEYVEAIIGYGINSVPTVIIGNRGIVGAVPSGIYREQIEAALAAPPMESGGPTE